MKSALQVLLLSLSVVGAFEAHGAPDPCVLLSDSDVASVLPNAARSHVPRRDGNGASTEGCAWIRGLDSLALTLVTAPKAQLNEAFDQNLHSGAQAIGKLGDRAAFASRVRGSGEFVVLVGDTMIGLTLNVRGADQQRSALEQLARTILDRR